MELLAMEETDDEYEVQEELTHLRKVINDLREECSNRMVETSMFMEQLSKERYERAVCERQVKELQEINAALVAQVETFKKRVAAIEVQRSQLQLQINTMLQNQLHVMEEVQTGLKKKRSFLDWLLRRNRTVHGQQSSTSFLPKCPMTTPPTEPTLTELIDQHLVNLRTQVSSSELAEEVDTQTVFKPIGPMSASTQTEDNEAVAED